MRGENHPSFFHFSSRFLGGRAARIAVIAKAIRGIRAKAFLKEALL